MSLTEDMKDEDKQAIDELRKRVKNDIEEDLYDDIYLFYRFLIARDFNIDNAEDMLRKHIEWRKKHDIRNILNFKMPEVLEKYQAYVLVGFDKEGCPVRYWPIGDTDLIGILASVKLEDLVKALLYFLESDTRILKEQSEKLKKNIHKCVYIVDMKNLTFAQATHKPCVSLLIFHLSMYINNFPERLKACYIINAPIFFNVVYSLMKSLLPVTVIQKIVIYSDDTYKKDILKLVDDDQLPAFVGGTQTDTDGNPLCVKKYKLALQTVPEKYFIHRSKRSLSKLPGVQKVTLSRAAFHEVKLEVKEPNSYLEWEFETKCRDIGFGLFLNEIVDGEEKVTELVPLQRIETVDYSETGTVKCEFPGTYTIVFDNTYSWIRAKEIYFTVKIVLPEEYDAEINQK